MVKFQNIYTFIVAALFTSPPSYSQKICAIMFIEVFVFSISPSSYIEFSIPFSRAGFTSMTMPTF